MQTFQSQNVTVQLHKELTKYEQFSKNCLAILNGHFLEIKLIRANCCSFANKTPRKTIENNYN